MPKPIWGNQHLTVWLVMICACGFFLTGCAGSHSSETTTASDKTLTSEEQALNLESFDVVWQTIYDQHYDETLGGLDWQVIGEELRPQVALATNMHDARLPMQDLIGRLEQSHFVIYPADVYDDAAANHESAQSPEDSGRVFSHSGRPGSSGIELRVLEGQVLIIKVDEDSATAAMGVVPGWEILTIDKVELATRVEKLTEVLGDEPMLGMVLSRSIEARLGGEEGDRIPVVCLDGDQNKVLLDLVLGPAPGHAFTMGNLPTVRVWTEEKVLPGNMGYFYFNYYLDVMTVMGAYNTAMTNFRELPGVVIDLRGNPGGLGAMAMGMAGWFVQERGLRLGTMIMRTGEMNFVINTRANGYRGKVALLIDDLSASTSEIMAGGLQDLGLVKIFGMTSAGAALPSNIIKLPNGDGFQYAMANYISEGGEVLEGVGVTPDVIVIPTRESLLAQGDPILEAARQWLLQTKTTED